MDHSMERNAAIKMTISYTQNKCWDENGMDEGCRLNRGKASRANGVCKGMKISIRENDSFESESDYLRD